VKPDESVQYDDFSLVAGGTFYGFLRRARLLRPPMGLLSRRIAVIVAILWMPMLILTILEGHAWSGVAVPFLADVETYVRFFAALPLMIFWSGASSLRNCVPASMPPQGRRCGYAIPASRRG
jgi:hypothetical protein